jgi:hypothetical protein
MSIDWDKLVLAPVMGTFGEAETQAGDQRPIYTPRGLAPFRLDDAVFDAEYEQVDVAQDGSMATSRRPVLGVRVSLFPRDPRQNDAVTIPVAGKSYIVREAQPDGHGHAKLMLTEAA